VSAGIDQPEQAQPDTTPPPIPPRIPYYFSTGETGNNISKGTIPKTIPKIGSRVLKGRTAPKRDRHADHPPFEQLSILGILGDDGQPKPSPQDQAQKDTGQDRQQKEEHSELLQAHKSDLLKEEASQLDLGRSRHNIFSQERTIDADPEADSEMLSSDMLNMGESVKDDHNGHDDMWPGPKAVAEKAQMLPQLSLKRHTIQVTSARDFNNAQSHKTLALLNEDFDSIDKVRVRQPDKGTLLEGHFQLADENVVKRMEYNDRLKQLIESIKPDYVHLKYEKIGFSEHNRVAAIDTAEDLEDLVAEKEGEREERRVARIEERLQKNGGKTPADLNDIDGMSSASSVDATNGKYNFDTGVVEKFQDDFHEQVAKLDKMCREM